MTNLVNNYQKKHQKLLDEIEEIVFRKEKLNFNQALSLVALPDFLIPRLAQIANKVRQRFSENKVDLCSIINARSGRCAEDCKFCAQSARYNTNNTQTPTYPMKSVPEIVESAKRAEERGAHRFCIVTSGARLSERDFATALAAIKRIKSETNLKRCASLGTLSVERARLLKQAGLQRFHHNLETARSFFSQICTTHKYEDRLQTLNYLEEVGIERCVGGILNLGETPEQRIEFAFELSSLNPSPISVPINFLNPRPGTPLAHRPLMPPLEAIKYLAIFRLILPESFLRLAGGRGETFGKQPELPFKSGINALLIGDLLTTKGPATKSDLNLLTSLGFKITLDA